MGVFGPESGECVGVLGWGCLWAVDGVDEAVADECKGEGEWGGGEEGVGGGYWADVEESVVGIEWMRGRGRGRGDGLYDGGTWMLCWGLEDTNGRWGRGGGVKGVCYCLTLSEKDACY